jgi:hypothetical protein
MSPQFAIHIEQGRTYTKILYDKVYEMFPFTS